MRIIEKKPLEMEITCGRCKSVLGVASNDLSKGSHRDIDGWYDSWYYVTCPVCFKEICLKGDEAIVREYEDEVEYTKKKNSEMTRDY